MCRIPETIGKQIEKESQGVYPLSSCFIRKVKVLKSPKVDTGKLMELHGEGAAAAAAASAAAAAAAAAPSADTGKKV